MFPYTSVSVTMTLLKVALIYTRPWTSTLIFFFFRTGAVGAGFVASMFLLTLVKGYLFAIAFFLPATVFLFPFRVRAFVRVL